MPNAYWILSGLIALLYCIISLLRLAIVSNTAFTFFLHIVSLLTLVLDCILSHIFIVLLQIVRGRALSMF